MQIIIQNATPQWIYNSGSANPERPWTAAYANMHGDGYL